ncbi:MAG: hypothetical protein H0X33_05955 [Taibaiella sp.]|nr:hypothetical protein [Taibaiella sp.]
MHHFKKLLFITILLFSWTSDATTRKILFIGNSYTYTNSMPAMLQSLAAAMGDTLVFSQSDPGGYTFEEHCSYAPTISLIFSQQWDMVVLQEQSELPSFSPSQVDTQVYPYAHKLDSMIRTNDSCTQTMFMMTWGHADGDRANCAIYPFICTYDGMQLRLRESYLQMTKDNNAIVAPVGAAWKVVRDSFPSIGLYQSDNVHPALTGSYLQTCVLYSSIFHKRTTGSSYLGGVLSADAAILQHIADKVTMDSLIQWQQYGHYPYAGFSYSLSANTVTFIAGNPIVANNEWTFGDGAHNTASDPVHTYSSSGSYITSHTVSNSCFTETQTGTVHIGMTGINNVGHSSMLKVAEQGSNISFISVGNDPFDQMNVYNMDGRNIGHYIFKNNKVIINLPPGIYIYRAFSLYGDLVSGKLSVNY